jgi:CRP-like cAMP-binding protein
MAPPNDANPIIAKLGSIFALSDEEKAAIMRLPLQVQDLRADQDIVREGDRPSRCCALLEGLTSTYKVTQEGKRQINAFQIAGDIPDLLSLHLRTLDVSLCTLTACRVAFIQHEPLRELCHAYPRVADAFWRQTLIEGSVIREWMLNVGRREAYDRLSHLLCELVTRMRAVGLVRDHACELPITQGEFADATGLSTVHVNRTIQELRAAGLIRLKGKVLTVLDWEGLKRAGEFSPVYLHLEQLEAA